MLLPRKSYEILSKHFVSLVIDNQEYLSKDENLEKVLGVILSICKLEKNETIPKSIATHRENLFSTEGSFARWEKIEKLFTLKYKDQAKIYEMVKKELTIGLLYPKIDSHVSAQANHLLKCPFNVHHDSGKLSLPILDVEKFDVEKCLTIFDVLENKDRLEPYLEAFDKFCEPLINIAN